MQFAIGIFDCRAVNVIYTYKVPDGLLVVQVLGILRSHVQMSVAVAAG